MQKELLVLCALSLSLVGFSQRMDNRLLLRETGKNNQWKVHYDNDLFAGQDQNYSQGFRFDYSNVFFSKNPLNKFVIGKEDENTQYGMSVLHQVYTPEAIEEKAVQFGDRPYAAMLFLEMYKSTLIPTQKMKVSSGFSAGIIGQSAFGKAMQTTIHKASNGIKPEGWDNQMRNQPVFNYNAGIENEFFRYKNIFAAYTDIFGNIGNLTTNAIGGVTFVLGKTNSLFTESTSDFQIYLFSRPAAQFVLYDASINGAWLNDEIYRIAFSNTNRFVSTHNFGLVIQSKKVFFEFSFTQISQEIKTAENAIWGGLKLGWVM
ncbi:MAG: lipid A 3-O-deacylase [Psychromonas sp.]|jgi:lipid A 3-O-deacylase